MLHRQGWNEAQPQRTHRAEHERKDNEKKIEVHNIAQLVMFMYPQPGIIKPLVHLSSYFQCYARMYFFQALPVTHWASLLRHL